MGRGKRKWNVGDWYFVIQDGHKIWGEIVEVDKLGYHVAWNDLSCTIEEYPDPAQEWHVGGFYRYNFETDKDEIIENCCTICGGETNISKETGYCKGCNDRIWGNATSQLGNKER